MTDIVYFADAVLECFHRVVCSDVLIMPTLLGDHSKPRWAM